MKYASLFSGVGGFDLGFDRAGMECVLQVEQDKHALSVLRRHWPDVPKMEDVCNVTAKTIGAVDLICGGFPCQDVSVAGRRAGLDGERSGLWFEFHRILSDVKPAWVVIENVPGLLSSNGGRDFAVILHGLVNIGYGVVWRVLDSQYFGVPQRRRRLFIVGHLGTGRAAQVLFERESVPGNPPPRRKARKAAPAVSGTIAASGAGTARPAGQRNELDMLIPFRLQAFGQYTQGNSASTIQSRDYKYATDLIAQAINVRNLRFNGGISGTLQAKSTGGYSLNYTNPIAFRWYSGQGVSAARVCPTLMVSNSHVPAIAYYGVRRLTPVECERLQGFPDGWASEQSDAQRYKQMGNAITVTVAEWIGQRIVQADEQITHEESAA